MSLRTVDLARREVAALCVSGRSIYKHRPGVVAFDQRADARTFKGGIPVVAHPPCRCWSKFLRHQARPANRHAEMDLGRWCVDQVIRHGGVLEQPAGSLLWEDCALPKLGDLSNRFLYTVYIEQIWFGYATPKPTWILVCGVPPADLAPVPYSLRRSELVELPRLNKEQRSFTVPALADWLLMVARSTWWSLPVRPYFAPVLGNVGRGVVARRVGHACRAFSFSSAALSSGRDNKQGSINQNPKHKNKTMVGKFQVIDHSSVTYPASERGPARTNHFMHLLDLGECPMRQMPRYQLTDAEVEQYAGGKLNGQVVHLEVREMNGAGNPIMRGRIIKAEKQQVAKAA